MVQQFNTSPVPTQASMLGQALGQGIGRNFEQPEQRVQRGLLGQAFEKLRNGDKTDPLAMFESIAPTLMTSQGGPELLGILFPMLQNQAKSEAARQASQNRDAKNNGQKGKPGIEPTQNENQQGFSINPNQQDQQTATIPPPSVQGQKGKPTGNKHRQTQPEVPPTGSNFPEQVGNIEPIMSSQQMEKWADDYVTNSGGVADRKDGMQQAIDINNQRVANNTQVEQAKDRQRSNIAAANTGILERAKKENMLQDSEDQTQLEKLIYKFRDEPDPGVKWENIRDGFRPYQTAKAALMRESELPGGFDKIGRKMMGTYKDKKTVMDNAQVPLKYFTENGLFEEARNIIQGAWGFGPEDTEATLFPMTKEQEKTIDAIPKNKNSPFIGSKSDFPGVTYIMEPKEYGQFKEDLSKWIDKNNSEKTPINLQVMRGKLNQDKRYAWQDISRAMNELIAEKRFIPDSQQAAQLAKINNAPLPGLLEMFDFWWKGKK